jgi:type I restriction enzyme R subunit
VVTTLIHKFTTAASSRKLGRADRNTFIKFGDLFRPANTISRAVEDKAVKPLLYEARHVPQEVERDAKERQTVLEENGKSAGAKADMIAAATRHVIEHEIAKDPAFYKKFSRPLEEVIEAYHEGRLKALEALEKVKDISTKVVTHTDDDVPYDLVGKDMTRRYFGCVREPMAVYAPNNDNPGTQIALRIVERISPHKIRDWRSNQDAINKMRGEIDDIFFEVAEEHDLALSLDEQDAIIDRCIEVAIANED